jgi:hypothetical protein
VFVTTIFGGHNVFSPIKIMGPKLTKTKNIPTNEKVHSIFNLAIKVPQICLKPTNQLLENDFHFPSTIDKDSIHVSWDGVLNWKEEEAFVFTCNHLVQWLN